MDLRLLFFAFLSCLGYARPHGGARLPLTIDRMTCAQAKAYGKRFGRVWVHGAGDDIVPIYPINDDPYSLGCPTGDFGKPQFYPTLDEHACVISWRCGK